MQHWELLCPGGLSFVCDDGLFQPSTDSFLLGSFPRLKPGLRAVSYTHLTLPTNREV